MDEWLNQICDKNCKSCVKLSNCGNNSEGYVKQLDLEKNVESSAEQLDIEKKIIENFENATKKFKNTQKYHHEYTQNGLLNNL